MEPLGERNTEERTWGLYPWFQEHGTHLVHPNDLEAWVALQPYGRVFERVGEEGEFLKLAYGNHVFRVKPDFFRPVRSPSKRIGDVVRLESGGEVKEGTIVEIQWHHQRNEPFYLLKINGKRSSRRYWDSDFK